MNGVPKDVQERMVALRRALHRDPELSWQEERSAGRIAAHLSELGIEHRTGLAGHGVVADLPGAGTGPRVALRADMDALPVQEETGLPFASETPGVMHACGHDGHSAMLLGAAALLASGPPPPRPVRLIWQPAEEKGAGAAAMIEAGALEGVGAIFGGHVDRRYPAGVLIVSEGPVNASTDSFRIEIHGQQGHGARPHEAVDAVVVGSLLVTALQTIVSREVDPAHPSVVSIGSFHAGTAPNVIAGHALLEGTIRAQSPLNREQLRESIERIAAAIGQLHGAKVTCDVRRGTPPVINAPLPTQVARAAAEHVAGAEGVVPLHTANMGGEDFSYYLEQVPGAYIRFGAQVAGREGYPAHSSRFDIDESALATGAAWMAEVEPGRSSEPGGGVVSEASESGVLVREAVEDDVDGIREIFLAVYGEDYPYQGFRDTGWLKRSVFGDNILMLVAEEQGRLLGTASVVLDTGAHSDLVGEFGRLAVHPDARGKGVGGALMRRRIALVQNRLHVGIVENRAVHPFSQRISMAQGFAPVGFLPMKHPFSHRESISLFARHFGACLSLRNNHPRIAPEVHTLAHLALEHCGLPGDTVIDEDTAPYPPGGSFITEELTDAELPSLLRIARGRVRNREVFGPMRLSYGFFKLQASKAGYLLACDQAGCSVEGPIAGAVGYIRDDAERALRVFELITGDENTVHVLFSDLVRRCEEWGIEYVEVDVSAHAPRLQRTLLQLGFLPAAYVPAMVFHDVERLDVVKMVRLLTPIQLGAVELVPQAQVIADVVMRGFVRQAVLPRVAAALDRLDLLKGLNEEQTQRVAGVCTVVERRPGEQLFGEGEAAEQMYVVIDGELEVSLGDATVGAVGPGESVGEVAFLTGGDHSATVTAGSPLQAAELSKLDLAELTRLRPDIGVVLYRNLALGLGRKLRRTSKRLQRR